MAPPLLSKKAVLPPISGSGQAPAPPQVMAALHQLEADILSTNEDGVVGLHHVDFWLNICICHSLLVETNPDGSKRYQGPSPDEVALVETARQLGFVFKSRDADSVHLEFQVRDPPRCLDGLVWPGLLCGLVGEEQAWEGWGGILSDLCGIAAGPAAPVCSVAGLVSGDVFWWCEFWSRARVFGVWCGALWCLVLWCIVCALVSCLLWCLLWCLVWCFVCVLVPGSGLWCLVWRALVSRLWRMAFALESGARYGPRLGSLVSAAVCSGAMCSGVWCVLWCLVCALVPGSGLWSLVRCALASCL